VNELVTRCPTCGTAFRVLPTQLSARSGMVRCGKCSGVFDALAHLVEAPPESAPPEPSPQLGLFDAAARGAASVPGAPLRTRSRRRSSADDEPLPEFLEEEVPRSRFSIVWGLAAFLAFAALALQLVYHYRADLAVLAPQVKPYLVEGCRFLDCEIRRPHRQDLLRLEYSELQADNARENLVTLHAGIRNVAPFVQDYPSLELTLTDDIGRPVARRVLRPEDYLRGRSLAAREAGLAPGAEAALSVPIDKGDLKASGYKLYHFFPD